jgi:hypothetical protein
MEEQFRIFKTTNKGKVQYSVHKVYLSDDGKSITDWDREPIKLEFDNLLQLNYNMIKSLNACTHDIMEEEQDTNSFQKAMDIFKNNV